MPTLETEQMTTKRQTHTAAATFNSSNMRRQWLFTFSISLEFVALIWTIVVFRLCFGSRSCSHRLVFFSCCLLFYHCFSTIGNVLAMVWSCRSALFQSSVGCCFFSPCRLFLCVQLDLWRNAVARTMCINWSKEMCTEWYRSTTDERSKR